MQNQLRPAIVLFAVLTIITGIIYPAVVTGLAQLVFPHQANGSVIERDGHAIGSELIGQSFTQPKYFWGRLSATAPTPYNAAASSGSNLGPLNPALMEAVKGRIEALRQAGSSVEKVPVDLVTASASGLDPHVSPAAAEFQVPRIAAVRQMSEDAVRRLVEQHTEGRQWGLFGESRVNVLQLNLALDAVATSK